MTEIPVTKDGEWGEDELLSLVMDQCFHKCKELNADIAKGVNMAWYDMSLLYPGILCEKITDEISLTGKYDELGGLEPFESWAAGEVARIVADNKYKGYRDN